MDLFRLILQRIEGGGSLDIEGHDKKSVLYHLALMDDAGFMFLSLQRVGRFQFLRNG